MCTFTAQQLTNTAWSYASRKFAHETLIQALAAAALPRLTNGPSYGLVNFAWSLDVLDKLCGDGILTATIPYFFESCESSLGVEWVTLAGLLEKHGHVNEMFESRM